MQYPNAGDKLLPMVEAETSLIVRYPDFADRLQRYAAPVGVDIQAIKRALGVTYEMARRYWLGVSKPEDAKMRALADLVGVAPSLLDWGSAAEQNIAPYLSADKYVYVSRYNAAGGMGNGVINEHVEVSSRHAYRREWIEKNNYDIAKLAVIDAVGNSMEDTINDGDVVLVNLADRQLSSGKIYAIEDHEGTCIKRLFRQGDGKIKLVSDNPDKKEHADRFWTPEQSGNIIGRIIHRSGGV